MNDYIISHKSIFVKEKVDGAWRLFVAPSLATCAERCLRHRFPHVRHQCAAEVSQSTFSANAKGAPIRVPLMLWRRRWDLNPRAALTAYEISSHRPYIPPRPSSSQFTPKSGQNHPISSLLFGKMSEK